MCDSEYFYLKFARKCLIFSKFEQICAHVYYWKNQMPKFGRSSWEKSFQRFIRLCTGFWSSLSQSVLWISENKGHTTSWAFSRSMKNVSNRTQTMFHKPEAAKFVAIWANLCVGIFISVEGKGQNQRANFNFFKLTMQNVNQL